MSQFGSNLFDLAMAWYMATITSSALVIGAVTAVFNAIPLLSVATGAVVDRHRKTHIIALVNGLQIALMLIAAFIALRESSNLVFIVALIFVDRLLSIVISPAEDSLIPQLVDSKDLMKVNSMNQSAQMLAQILGMLVGGVIIALIPLSAFMLINAATFLVSFACMLWLINQRAETFLPSDDDEHRQWYQGIAYIRRSHVLTGVIMLAIVVNLALGPLMGLDSLWVRNVLHSTAFMYSAAQIAMIFGVILGNIAINAIKLSFKMTLVSSIVIMATGVLLLSSVLHPWATIVSMLVAGLGAGMINVTIFTLIQKTTPLGMLGRVNGALLAATNVALPIGMAAGGAFATGVGLANVFRAGAVITLIAGLVTLTRPWNINIQPDNNTDTMTDDET